jgi:hypothetical protein
MILRSAVSVLAAVAALTACSSSSGGGSPSVANSVPAPGGGGSSTAVVASGGGGSSADFCANLTTATTKLGGLTTTGNAGDFGALKTALAQEVSAFQGLDNGAPAEVKPAIDDIITGLQSAESAVSDPNNPDLSKLSGLATKLPGDITKLTTYAAANCH